MTPLKKHLLVVASRPRNWHDWIEVHYRGVRSRSLLLTDTQQRSILLWRFSLDSSDAA
ncbi:MAG: hypothetical protein RIE73_36950 [Coleofasciculus sp. C1-SOL-03]|uniref:hypothetical protein n=1 Tax=Coleofasciculus sp. C1-SOL-03 TaxID=3069522 RepID=UPI0032FE72AE